MSEPQDAPATGPALIAERVMRSIVERKLRPGERLGEKELAEVFGVSRTMVREALMQLQARGFVEVRSRQGWYVVEPSFEEAQETYAARRVLESGMRSEEHTSELQSQSNLVCRLLLEKKKKNNDTPHPRTYHRGQGCTSCRGSQNAPIA